MAIGEVLVRVAVLEGRFSKWQILQRIWEIPTKYLRWSVGKDQCDLGLWTIYM